MTKSELVKELRARTDAGMSDCLKALANSNNDLGAAVEWLRKNGTIKAAKKAGAIAAEGIVRAFANEDRTKVVLIEINSQTDFVAKNEKFVNLVNKIGQYFIDEVDSEDQIADVKIENKTIEEWCIELTATVGEKINFRRAKILYANDGQSLGYYNHMNDRIASAILVEGHAEEQVLKNIAMHIAASNPKYLDEVNVSSEWIEKEREIVTEQVNEEISKMPDDKQKQNKLANKDRAIDGRVKKNLQEICLLKQKFVIDPNMAIEQYLKDHHLKALDFANFVLGEGIEKKACNFAEEVVEQMKQK